MLYDTILLRYGELFLKGKNRPLFEKKLVENIKKIAVGPKIRKIQGRLVADYFSEHTKLRNVFGLVSYSPALRAEKKEKSILEAAAVLLKGKKGTFKIETKRSDKSFLTTSMEFNKIAGMFIEKNTALSFCSENPETVLGIEINQDGAYLFLETISCFGGLPTGVEGKALLLVENEASLLAGLLFMKRGCSVIPVAFGDKDISLLQKFSPTTLSLKLVQNFEELERISREGKVEVLVCGQNYDACQSYSTKLLIMRPLIAHNAQKIKEELQKYSN